MKKLVFLGAFVALSASLMLAQADPEQTALAVAQTAASARANALGVLPPEPMLLPPVLPEPTLLPVPAPAPDDAPPDEPVAPVAPELAPPELEPPPEPPAP